MFRLLRKVQTVWSSHHVVALSWQVRRIGTDHGLHSFNISENPQQQPGSALDVKSFLTPHQRKLNILLMANKFNSLSQRVSLELQELGHTTHVVEPEDSEQMINSTRIFQPDLVLCPFLTRRIPEELWSSNRLLPCLIVHPGIEGDRGMHSLDWALKKGQTDWGVTILEAADEMDGGDIWANKNFSIVRSDPNTLTKSSLYAQEVTEAAVDATIEAVNSFILRCAPRPLDYNNPTVKGQLQAKMLKHDRTIDWSESADQVARHIRMSDSSPGAVARFQLGGQGEWSREFRVFGAHSECEPVGKKAKPGEVLGQRDGAILVNCGKGAVWISHLKFNKLKLPASCWISGDVPRLKSPPVELTHGTYPQTFQEIWTTVNHGVCYVHFNFYNGAMSTRQCQLLSQLLRQLRLDNRFSVVVLMGGHNFFSNGIHLNVIEQAHNPTVESWNNINAINDVVREIFSMTNKVTVSALQGNAGAGGVMVAIASDIVWSREGVVLNPHYKTMHLHGSEYHTYFLPKRVGDEMAKNITAHANPMLATQAKRDGLITDTLGRHHVDFLRNVEVQATQLARRPILGEILKAKVRERSQAAWLEDVERCRREELEIMRQNFSDSAYHLARKNFVYH